MGVPLNEDGSCYSPMIVAVPSGDYLKKMDGEPVNEPCYAKDACSGYVTCCVKKGTCKSEHSGLVSSTPGNYVGGCYSPESSKKSQNTFMNCTQVGECDEYYIEKHHGGTTKNAADKATLSKSSMAHLKSMDMCMCAEGMLYDAASKSCICDKKWVESSCYHGDCSPNATRCDGVPAELVQFPDEGLSTGAIIGIAVGGGVGALLLIGIVAYMMMPAKPPPKVTKEAPPA